MKLGTFAALGVSGVPDREWDLRIDSADASAAADVVVVVGPPGSGKSQWLRSVAAHKEAVAAYGSLGWIAGTLRKGAQHCKTSATWLLTDDEQRYGGFPQPFTPSEVIVESGGMKQFVADPGLIALFDRWDPAVSLGRVASLPPARVPLPYPSGASDVLLEQRVTALAEDATKLSSAVGQLKRALRDGSGDARVDVATSLVEAFDVGVRVVGVSGDGDLEVALRGGERVGLGRASTSQVQAVATAAFFAFARLRNGVVLYDSPEAGLPAGLAARWVEALHAAEPSNQWIVATSDPAVAGIRDARVVDLGSAA